MRNSIQSSYQTVASNMDEKRKHDLLPPLTNGLIILSLMRLRDFAHFHLPKRSRLKEGFLEDIADLENPDLGREEKRRVSACWSV